MLTEQQKIHRILDANINRLREALRVIEEYFRFGSADESAAVELKLMRHELHGIETGLDPRLLLECRDTAADPFAGEVRPEESAGRDSMEQVLAANLKRGQEAARVLEEYLKAVGKTGLPDAAKRIRFQLYAGEKKWRRITR